MTEQHYEAIARMHQTRARLLGCGWSFRERKLGDGFEVIAEHPAGNGGVREIKKLWSAFYSDALNDALQYASHAQAKADAKVKS